MSDGLFDYLDIAKQPQVFPSQLCTAIGDYAFNQCPRPSNCPPFSQKPCERLQLVPGIPSLWSPANSSSRSTKVAVHEVSWTLKQQPSNMMKFLRPHCSHTDTGSSYKSYEPLPVQAFLHELWGEANRLQVLAKAENTRLSRRIIKTNQNHGKNHSYPTYPLNLVVNVVTISIATMIHSYQEHPGGGFSPFSQRAEELIHHFGAKIFSVGSPPEMGRPGKNSD